MPADMEKWQHNIHAFRVFVCLASVTMQSLWWCTRASKLNWKISLVEYEYEFYFYTREGKGKGKKK